MKEIGLTFMVGTWFIIQTNFPMWLKGDKLNPTLNYTLIERKGQPMLLDVVKYTHKGKQKTITGYDKADAENPYIFYWRGKGLLAIASSKCDIRLRDPKGQWAVSWFSKTAFSPEGVEIISKTPTLPPATLSHIKQLMQADTLLAPFVNTLKDLPKEPK